MARLNIISDSEVKNYYELPRLIKGDRILAFELDEFDVKYLNSISSIPKKINYILQLGYFKISEYFFTFTFRSVRKDVRYIVETYFPDEKIPKKDISNNSIYGNRDIILEKYQISQYSKPFEAKLTKHLKDIVKHHALPKYLFESALDYCDKSKIIRPKYSILQKIISNTCIAEHKRINNKLYKLLDKDLRDKLELLLTKDNLFFQFTNIKKDQKDFSYSEIRSTIIARYLQ